MRIRSLRRRGFTLVEVVIASLLAAGLALAVSSALDVTSRSAKRTLTDAVAQQQNREVVEYVTRFLRGAQPLGTCLQWNGSTCRTVGTTGSAFAALTPSEISFYTYTTADTGDTSEYAPDRVTVKVQARGDCSGSDCWELIVEVRCNNPSSSQADRGCRAPTADGSLSYTKDSAATLLATRQPIILRSTLVRSETPFDFLSASSDPFTCAETAPGAPTGCDLGQVAVVRLDLDGDGSPELALAPPSGGFNG